MSWVFLRKKDVLKARKDYSCDACFNLLQEGDLDQIKKELSNNEKIEFQKAIDSDFKIKKGEPYTLIVGVFEGDICNIRMKESIRLICNRLNLFED